MPSHPGTASGTSDNTGACSIMIQHNKSGIQWTIWQVAIKTAPPGALNVEVLYNAFPLMTPTAMISGAAADGSPPITIQDHDILYFNVTGAVPKSQVTLAYYYDEENAGT